MKHDHPRASCVNTLQHLCLGLLAAAWAHADATTYTYRELAKPLAATSCDATIDGVRFPGMHHMSDAGDVLGGCKYFSGSVRSLDINGKIITVKSYVRRPIVWSASGVQRTLSAPAGYGLVDVLGMDATGKVIAAVAPITGNGNIEWYAWQGSKRSKVTLPGALPSSLPAPNTSWGIQYMSHTGVFLLENTRDAKLAIWSGSNLEVMDRPTMTDCSGDVNVRGMVSDNRQAIVHTYTWAKGAWQVIANPNQPGQPMSGPLAIGNHGQFVAGGTNFSMQWWSPDSLTDLPNSSVPADRYFPALREGYPDVNNQDLIVGTGWFPSEPELANDIYSLRAAIWAHGAVTNLNTVANAPKGIVLNDAININDKGQILVQGWGNKLSGGAPAEHIGILTPQ